MRALADLGRLRKCLVLCGIVAVGGDGDRRNGVRTRDRACSIVQNNLRFYS